MGWMELAREALNLTGTILTFIQDSRAWKMKKDVENILEEIDEQEKVVGYLRDDQLLDELRDDFTRKFKLFNGYISTANLQLKDNSILPEG